MSKTKKEEQNNLNEEFLLIEKKQPLSFEVIPTGLKLLDAILNGGVMTRAINLITGVTGCGKSQLVLQIAKQFKEKGYTILYFDTEIAITPQRLQFFGLDLGNNLYNYTYTIEEFDKDVLDKMKITLEKNRDKKVLLIIDSITAMKSEKVLSSAVDDNLQPGLEAKQLTILLNKLMRMISTYNITAIVTSHLKQNIVMPMQSTHGTLTDAGYRIPGGASLLYYTSQLISLHKKQSKTLNNIELKYIQAKILKSRLSPSDKSITLIYADKYGFFDLLSNLVFLTENNVITQSAGRYTFPFIDKKFTLKDVIHEYKTNNEFAKNLNELIDKAIDDIIIKPLREDANNNKPQQTIENIMENIAEEEFEL